MDNQQQVIDNLPQHLRPYVAVQNYDGYNARDHAVWRFLMHQLKANLQNSAHAKYLEGLAASGINFESVPHIEEMNAALGNIGWRAVVVNGFLPPAIFMEFQALKVLVVAVELRTYETMLYTPAPDILHESSGHAPFILDVDYSEFLELFGKLGMRAIANHQDEAVYQAIRQLSIIKENVNSSNSDIASAQRLLDEAFEQNTDLSEAALLARLHWWTVEYGLVGDLDDYQIFGAGLLSSLGESIRCLDDDLVKKERLTLDVINHGYDITQEQPRLFITKSCKHLTQVLREFERNMSVTVGGLKGLTEAIKAKTFNTAVYNSGLAVSGVISRVLTDAVSNPIYLQATGPCLLSADYIQLINHGVTQHPTGFGSPIGAVQGMSRCLSSYSIDELAQYGICIGSQVNLAFVSGIEVCGRLNKIERHEQKNILFCFDRCTVTHLNGDILFDPSWGVFDMAIGSEIVSVYGGSADKLAYSSDDPSPNTSAPTEALLDDNLMRCYERVRFLRASLSAKPNITKQKEIRALAEQVLNSNSDEWLLLFELAELSKLAGVLTSELDVESRLQAIANLSQNDQDKALIRMALNSLDTC